MAITTGKVRASYVNIFQPKIPENGGDPKYSVTLLIPKTDTATLNTIFAEIERAKQEGAQKVFNGNIPPVCRTPIHDGDGYRPSGEAFGEECRGCMVMTASAKNQPVIVDLNMQNIITPGDIYSGCYIRASISFFAYSSNGNKGIGCGLNAVQKIMGNDPRLAGKVYHDEMAGRAVVCAPLPWEPQIYPYRERQWRDEDDAGLRNYMELIYRITGKERILDGFAVFAMNHKVHRLRDYLLTAVCS